MMHATENKFTAITTDAQEDEQNTPTLSGGLPVRTNLRAGLAWDDLDDQAKGLWNSLSNAVSGLTGGAEASS